MKKYDENAQNLLWYAQPAQAWIEALPVGNGRLGAMVFGDSANERLQLNEETIWTGGPYDPTRPGGPEALPEIRRLVFEGKYFEAHKLFGETMMGQPVEQMKYQPLGNLYLEFPGAAEAADYRRQLDLDTALATVAYRVGEVNFRREVFASPVDQVIVVRITADKPGAVSFTAKLDGVINTKHPGDEWYKTEALDSGQLALHGKTTTFLGIEGRVFFEARVQVLQEGGKLAVDQDAVRVEGADTATLLIAAATNFKRYDDLSGDAEARVNEYLQRVKNKTYDRLRADHIAEHQQLFRRVHLNLSSTENSTLPTDRRLLAYNGSNDPQLAALIFQFGRYLLLCSSRPGCQPANLQGIWNQDMDPAWECKFTTNINLQMNYWPAEVAALPECLEPLTRMVKELSETGRRVAEIHYGAGGWVFHQNADQWLHSAPMDGPTWGTFATGGAWLCTHLWEHYRFGGDREYLREIYPLLKGSVQFFLDTLVEHPERRWLVTCPSTSPENFPVYPGNPTFDDQYGVTICAGSTIDMQILRDLFDACAEAAKILEAEADFRQQVLQARGRFAPMLIGKQGNLQEWLEDWEDKEPKHRHISHLYGLYPSNQITPEATPALAEAAKVSLNLREDGGTGFGIAWKIACWARLLDGERANLCLSNLVALQTCPNLFSKCFGPAQVEGAMGATAAIAELLLQSHAGEIHLLPALPKAWPEGKVAGLRARGGFEVDITWERGRLTSAAIRSILGGPCQVRAASRLVVKEGDKGIALQKIGDSTVRFETTRGGEYVVVPEAPVK